MAKTVTHDNTPTAHERAASLNRSIAVRTASLTDARDRVRALMIDRDGLASGTAEHASLSRDVEVADADIERLQTGLRLDEAALADAQRKVHAESIAGQTALATEHVALVQTRADAVARALKGLLNARDDLDEAMALATASFATVKATSALVGATPAAPFAQGPLPLALARAQLTAHDLGVGPIENSPARRFQSFLEIPQNAEQLVANLINVLQLPHGYMFQAKWPISQRLSDLREGPAKYLARYEKLNADANTAEAALHSSVAATAAQARKAAEQKAADHGAVRRPFLI